MRQDYEKRWERIRERFLADHDAQAALQALTSELDALVRSLAQKHLMDVPFCVLGIGGYGRGELYPFSDVDLLFLYRATDQSQAEASITRVLHDLWDMKLHLGQQVWSLEQLKSLNLDHLDFVLAALDVRIIAGEPSLGEEFMGPVFNRFLAENQRPLVEKIMALTADRHGSFRNTIYQLEPDIKQSPGGLRDHLVGKWLLRFQPGPAFLPFTADQAESAHAFLKKIRILLHFISGRDQNQLTHRLQEQLLPHLGYPEKDPTSGVESLMKEYFLNARIVSSFCLKAQQLYQPAGGVELLDVAEDFRFSDVEQVLEVFGRSIDQQRPLSDRTRTAIVQSLPSLSQSLVFPNLLPALRRLFKPRPGLYEGLSELYELGILELIFPEFGSIKARVIRDFYHKYTVDEHTLLTIKNIEDLLATEERTDRRFRALLEESPDAELLTISLLLHDVGKSREGKHSNRSAQMATRALQRLRFPRADIETMAFLIRNHLAMSSVILKRDLEDEGVIARFSDLINDPARLRLLCLLTYADIKAVAPNTLNDWKKDLLWQLYVSSYHKLTLGYGDERIEDEEDMGEKLLRRLPGDLDKEGFEAFLEGFPLRYLTTSAAEEIYEHYRLATQLNPDEPLQLRLVDRGSHYELCVVTPDQYYLFSKIVGLLSYFEMNILRGHGFANRQNTVLDIFQFGDIRDVFHLNPHEKERFRDLLMGAVEGRISIDKMLEGKEKSPIFRSSAPRFEPTIYFDDEHSDRYSVIEIVAPDSVGLLYRIGHEISELRCNIELVLISTEGEKAVDVFYLTHKGSKLSRNLQEQLKEHIIASIG